MDPSDFMKLAEKLQKEPNEASYRSAVSRAYYAVFNYAYRELSGMGVSLSNTADAHKEIYYLLHNCGMEDVREKATALDGLRRVRNNADYLYRLEFFPPMQAKINVEIAKSIMTFLSQKFSEGPEKEKLLKGIQNYQK